MAGEPQVGEYERLCIWRVHVVGVWLFHSNFGSLSSGVSEGVTNQSPEMGINYANHHLAMGQMTPILKKTYLPRSSLCDSGEPVLPRREARVRADLVLI